MTSLTHIRKGDYDIYIGRKFGYKHYGNPFAHKPGTVASVIVKNRAEAIKQYRRWLLGEDWTHLEPVRRQWVLNNLETLKGKTLGCWCHPKPCHGDVLIELINSK